MQSITQPASRTFSYRASTYLKGQAFYKKFSALFATFKKHAVKSFDEPLSSTVRHAANTALKIKNLAGSAQTFSKFLIYRSV